MKKMRVLLLVAIIGSVITGCNKDEIKFEKDDSRFKLLPYEYVCEGREGQYVVVDTNTMNLYFASPTGQKGFSITCPVYDENGNIEKYSK